MGEISSEVRGQSQLPDMLQTIAIPGPGLTLPVTLQLGLGHPIALHLQPGFTRLTLRLLPINQ